MFYTKLSLVPGHVAVKVEHQARTIEGAGWFRIRPGVRSRAA